MRILSLNVANSSRTPNVLGVCEWVWLAWLSHLAPCVLSFGGLCMAWARTPLPWECIGKMDAITIIPRLHSNVLFRSRHFISKLFKPNFLVKTKRHRCKRRRRKKIWWKRETGWEKELKRIEPKIPIENFIANFIIYYYCYPSIRVYPLCAGCTRLTGIFTSSTVS